MDVESGAVPPSLIRKLSYLAGSRAAEGHKGWVVELIGDPRVRRRGLLLAIPNTVTVALFSLLTLATGDRSSAVLLACAAVVVLIGGVASSWVIQRRTSWLAKRNDLSAALT